MPGAKTPRHLRHRGGSLLFQFVTDANVATNGLPFKPEGNMNAHVRPIDFDEIQIHPFDLIDPSIRPAAHGIHRVYKWCFFPAGYWEEADGSFVIFDRRYHPLARKRTNGSIEVLPVANFDKPMRIAFRRQHFLYSGGADHPCENERTQQRLIGVVQRLGIEGEVARRYETYRLSKLERRRQLLRSLRYR